MNNKIIQSSNKKIILDFSQYQPLPKTKDELIAYCAECIANDIDKKYGGCTACPFNENIKS